MKTLKKDELYDSLQRILTARGIELTDGSFTNRIRQGCELLTDAINSGTRTFDRARTEMDTQIEKMRQAIHEKTAPRKPDKTTAPAQPASQPKPKAAASRKPRSTAAKGPAASTPQTARRTKRRSTTASRPRRAGSTRSS
jgi:hypothetical protein